MSTPPSFSFGPVHRSPRAVSPSSQAALTRPCTATHTGHTHTLPQIKAPRLIEQYSSNGYIHRRFHLCRHKHTCSLSAPTKRSCSPLFLRKLAENLLNPSLLPLLCCVSAHAHPQRASETRAIRTWAGPLGIRPFSIDANMADYQKKKRPIGTGALFSIEGDLTALSRIKELQDVWELHFGTFSGENVRNLKGVEKSSVPVQLLFFFFLFYILKNFKYFEPKLALHLEERNV